MLKKSVFKVKMSTDLRKLQVFYRLFWLFILCHRVRFQNLSCTFGHLLNWAIASLKTHHSSVLYLWTSLGSRGLESALEWMNRDCLSEFFSSACQYLTIQTKTKQKQHKGISREWDFLRNLVLGLSYLAVPLVAVRCMDFTSLCVL